MAKTKALISFAVTAKLICVFVFAYAKSRFSHDAAHIMLKYTRFECLYHVTLWLAHMLVSVVHHLSFLICTTILQSKINGKNTLGNDQFQTTQLNSKNIYFSSQNVF